MSVAVASVTEVGRLRVGAFGQIVGIVLRIKIIGVTPKLPRQRQQPFGGVAVANGPGQPFGACSLFSQLTSGHVRISDIPLNLK
jgi:hypothetical protein